MFLSGKCKLTSKQSVYMRLTRSVTVSSQTNEEAAIRAQESKMISESILRARGV